jgi:Na+/Pi-cotransporter
MIATIALIELVGYVILLLWGMHTVQNGVVRAFGSNLRRVIGRTLRNRFPAIGAGLVVTALLEQHRHRHDDHLARGGWHGGTGAGARGHAGCQHWHGTDSQGAVHRRVLGCAIAADRRLRRVPARAGRDLCMISGASASGSDSCCWDCTNSSSPYSRLRHRRCWATFWVRLPASRFSIWHSRHCSPGRRIRAWRSCCCSPPWPLET